MVKFSYHNRKEGLTMTHQYHDIVRDFIRKEVLETASKLNLTNEETAEKLRVSVRNYSYFKSGEQGCSAETLSLYLVNLCIDKIDFLNRLEIVINEAESKL